MPATKGLSQALKIILPPLAPTELLSHLFELSKRCFSHCDGSNDSTQPLIYLIICSSRTAFVSSLAQATLHSDEYLATQPETAMQESMESLLAPTLAQMQASKKIQLHFVTTVTHLRALLSIWEPGWEKSNDSLDAQSGVRQDKTERLREERQSVLFIYGLIALHRDTSDWSAQGLGSTLATAVEAGWREGVHLVLGEEPMIKTEHDEEIRADLMIVEGQGVGQEDWDDTSLSLGVRNMEEVLYASRDRPHEQHAARPDESVPSNAQLWDERLPMLNGSVRRDGMGVDNRWSGRTVEVGRVLSRWFRTGLIADLKAMLRDKDE